MDCSGVYTTPRLAQMLPHNWTYSSSKPGAAGTEICPSASVLRYIRLPIASRSIDRSNDLEGPSSPRLFYTTEPVSARWISRRRGLTLGIGGGLGLLIAGGGVT